MPTMRESRQALRNRFLIAKGLRTLWEIRAEVDLNAGTLKKFVEGASITTANLERIEDWVTQQESLSANTKD